MNKLFITGMLRSGTTLLQMLLDQHPLIAVAYQPYHQFYVNIKIIYNRENGIDSDLPISHEINTPSDDAKFGTWLQSRIFNGAETHDLISMSTTGKGGGFNQLNMDSSTQPQHGNFYELLNFLYDYIDKKNSGRKITYIGTKDILCEEYIPPLANNTTKCLIIIRDPRGVIASASHGRYKNKIGDNYPILMLIRLWRKSAAYWMNYKQHPNVYALRYEDLVNAPQRVLDDIANWLQIAPLSENIVKNFVLNASTNGWSGNSSFEDFYDISRNSAKRWGDILNEDQIRFIEACTYPEIKLLGYSYHQNLSGDDIKYFHNDFCNLRAKYTDIHALTNDNINSELLRWKQHDELSHQ